MYNNIKYEYEQIGNLHIKTTLNTIIYNYILHKKIKYVKELST